MKKSRKLIASLALAGAVAGVGSVGVVALAPEADAAFAEFKEFCEIAGGVHTAGTYASACSVQGMVFFDWNW